MAKKEESQKKDLAPKKQKKEETLPAWCLYQGWGRKQKEKKEGSKTRGEGEAGDGGGAKPSVPPISAAKG